ncbi:MAG: hypothetical protein P4N59_30530 [Negativicutes bacterium]|nr:hypothetical protein [Negativicutes bacterium]
MALELWLYSIITKVETVAKKFPGGLKAYLKVPGVYHDDFLVADIHTHMYGVYTALSYLSSYGFTEDEFVIVRPDMAPNYCWLETKRETAGNPLICWLKGTSPGMVIRPMINEEKEGQTGRVRQNNKLSLN